MCSRIVRLAKMNDPLQKIYTIGDIPRSEVGWGTGIPAGCHPYLLCKEESPVSIHVTGRIRYLHFPTVSGIDEQMFASIGVEPTMPGDINAARDIILGFSNTPTCSGFCILFWYRVRWSAAPPAACECSQVFFPPVAYLI